MLTNTKFSIILTFFRPNPWPYSSIVVLHQYCFRHSEICICLAVFKYISCTVAFASSSYSNMSSKSDECGSCHVVATPNTPNLTASVVSQETPTNVTGNSSQVIASLLEQNNGVRAEILALENLLCEKYSELIALQNADPHQGVDSMNCSNQYKLQRAVSLIDDLERFSQEDGLNEDAIEEYIRYLEYMYTRVPIIGPDAVQMICYSPLERTRQFLESKKAPNEQKLMFVLKDVDRYSLLLYDATNASFNLYDMTKERNELAQQLIFTLRQCFDVQQVIDVEEDSLYTDSALFCIDNMIKIILSAEEESLTTTGPNVQSSQSPVSQPPSTPSPVQLMQIHSQPDYLKIIIMSRYIVTKLSHIEKLCSGDVEQRWSMSS